MNSIQSWWGNTVYKNTADWNMASVQSVANGTTFGFVLQYIYSPLNDINAVADFRTIYQARSMVVPRGSFFTIGIFKKLDARCISKRPPCHVHILP